METMRSSSDRFVLCGVETGIDSAREQIAHTKTRKVETTMKQVRYILLTLTDGTQKMVATKTTTETYIRRLIRDLRISVLEWEVI